MQPPRSQTDWKGKRVTVMGLGRHGGGVGAVRFLCARGAQVTVTDLLTENELASSLSQLDGCRLAAVHFGQHRESDFSQANLVVVNPAVPRDNVFLDIARRAGVPLSSEMRLFWRSNPAPVIGVTGSNGKSTTAALIHAILAADGRTCWLGGNIGRSLLPRVDEIQPEDWVVLELSSFQLEDLDADRVSPHVAVVTNFCPNHLDRHGSLDAYRRAKQTILRWQSPGDVAVLNALDPDVATWRTSGRRVLFGQSGPAGTDQANVTQRALAEPMAREDRPLAEWLNVPGPHNLQNAAAAACATLKIGAEREAVRRGLRGFSGLPHRLQFVGEAAGRIFYNDSKATTPESVVAALAAFDQPVVLLAGGYDKHVDLTPMARAIAARAKAVALMGQTSDRLADSIAQLASIGQPVAERCEDSPALKTLTSSSLAHAFEWAVAQSDPGDVVLLSPGCASYDWFRDFEDRGERFTDLATAWCAAHSDRGGRSISEFVASAGDFPSNSTR